MGPVVDAVRLGLVQLFKQGQELQVPGERLFVCLIDSPNRASGATIGTQVDVDDDPHAVSLNRDSEDVPRESP